MEEIVSKINAVRLINLNYNNSTIRVSDETFQFRGESTLLSLRNGGGKSVLVQMLMAPFVHKRYQNAKDRPFSSYFTTGRPTFILVEWMLDQGAGYVLTGMMVRRNQEPSEEGQDELEMINFIAEYKDRCQQDIYHLPVVEKTKKDITLKSFGVCRQLFETWKRERGIPFFYYDMNNSAQSKQYFDKLAEYQIYYKEWETIIKKVNLKESGLSDLFADCRDEKGLVEKWFLEAVENKLNQDKNRMKEFQNIMEKYTGLYKDNQSKIKRRDNIRAFGQEAEQVRSHALRFREMSRGLKKQEAVISDFIRRLHGLEEREEEKARELALQIEGLAEKAGHLEYEKLSGEFYAIADREQFAQRSLELLRIEGEDLERRKQEIVRSLHVLACAKQQENVEECRAERDRELQRLALCREKQENLEPERNRLGSLLRNYYDALREQKEQEKDQCGISLRDREQKKEEGQKSLEELRGRESILTKRAGALDAKIRIFDGTEDQFNQEYREAWHRNLLGEYEAGALQIRGAEYEKELGAAEHARTEAKKEAGQYREQIRSMRRLLEDKTAEQSRLEAGRRENGNLLLAFEQELQERSVILRYLGMEQEELFDTDRILAAAQRRLLDIDLARQGLEKEADMLEKEYRKMAQGQVLELSEEFRGMLEEAGIQFVYGMEWLRKNQFPAEQNRKLAAQHPFLPYSLLLSGRELERLAGLPEQVYTSSPVPILLREELEERARDRGGAVCSLADVHFYVWFNDNLLDEEKLKEMLAQQDARIRKLRRAIDARKTEYAEYIGRQEKIRSQKVTGNAYETAKETAERQEKAAAFLEQEILAKREELDNLEICQMQKEQKIAELEKEILYQSRRLAEFGRFCQSYEAYRENCRLREKNGQEQERVLHLQKLEKEKLARLEQELITERNRLAALERETEECAGKQAGYCQYPGVSVESARLSREQAAEAENRYDVITSGISLEQKELEARAESAEKRYGRVLEEQKLLAVKYGLSETAWSGVSYDRKEEAHQEARLENQEQRIAGKKEQIHGTEIKCALLGRERENKLAQMKERCRKEEPIARESIQTIDFADAIRKLEYERGEAEKEEKQVQRKLQGYESNLAALAEYEEAFGEETGAVDSGEQGKEEVEWEFDFSSLSTAELTRQKGILIRDYNDWIEQRREAQSDVERALNRMIRMEAFGEEFYQKPLEAMLQLTGDAERMIRQLETTLSSYSSLMEKLQVDIALVEKEKAKIVELVGDYLKEVHDSLGRIDRNSTIMVRERPVKMLKIELPDWTENESLYGLRLRDYIDDVTAKGIALLEENRNVQEFLGTRITTKGIYDAVVGIGNVQIRLYKIEAQREYPITWAEVAHNSGGEGFLSAFVILSALLYYMRRDDSELFADRNEGKVLLMDNPFAQTNASHLLKPLMDMAKKANTQLICLSGLGGESIYNRFDNIYVLTLIAANLRSDMQYLKAEHMRGSEEETMLVSQIQVMEQQELVFYTSSD